jgi:Flp pilus assembly protein TadB
MMIFAMDLKRRAFWFTYGACTVFASEITLAGPTLEVLGMAVVLAPFLVLYCIVSYLMRFGVGWV